MARLRRGDSLALDELMRQWQVPLRRFLLHYLHDESEAMDVAQETFLRVYQYRKRFRPDARFSPWLFAIARNLARRRLRTRARRPTVSLEECQDALADETFPRAGATAASAAPDASLVRRELLQRIREAVAELPDALRSPTILCALEGFSQQDAAAIIGCSSKAIETRLYRARTVLRQTLAIFLEKK